MRCPNVLPLTFIKACCHEAASCYVFLLRFSWHTLICQLNRFSLLGFFENPELQNPWESTHPQTRGPAFISIKNNPGVPQFLPQALGLSEEEVQEKFGFFLRALDYGAPPHGGIALGMDRVVSMILGTSSIREVMAFPKNRSAYCPLTEAPAMVAQEHLTELGLIYPAKPK